MIHVVENSPVPNSRSASLVTGELDGEPGIVRCGRQLAQAISDQAPMGIVDALQCFRGRSGKAELVLHRELAGEKFLKWAQLAAGPIGFRGSFGAG